MGGNALKNVQTRRYKRDEYFALKQKVLELLKPYGEKIGVPQEFPNKESFGDLDVLFVLQQQQEQQKFNENDMKIFLKDLFHSQEIILNGDVYSLDYEQFQIDIICCKRENFDNCLVYLSYSDLGGLIGNIVNKIGLKYGQQGLWMNVHTKEFDPTTTSTQLILSINVEEIFSFLGYDYEIYKKGFENEEDYFSWIKSSKYFRRIYFNEDYLNHANRSRVRKRPIYLKFLQYLEDKNELDNRELISDDEKLLIRQHALKYFNKQHEYDLGIQQRQEKQLFREKYSGKYFIQHVPKTSIQHHMNNFQQQFGNEQQFHQWVLENDQKTIENEIEKYLKSINDEKNNV
ncbi:unnamed protein product [Didymodactylos carnosus]|uniref:Uncharacterized protein n=1 Tax=Didymodactylos carnosus TaxID=1234261 RepID=A0A813UDI6_9BILA|nr:unnamed protein product [Didymodactylos carnosus]CAF3611576.1 unnamed protein product [Didymodactylos carnosus]